MVVETVEMPNGTRVESPQVGYAFVRFHVAADKDGDGQETLAVACGEWSFMYLLGQLWCK